MLDLIEATIKANTQASYVLIDTWICSPSSLIAITDKWLDVIAMVKKSKMHYLYNLVMQPLNERYKEDKKRIGWSKYLLYVEITDIKDGVSIPTGIVYVRNRNKRNAYLTFIITDMTISEESNLYLWRTFGILKSSSKFINFI